MSDIDIDLGVDGTEEAAADVRAVNTELAGLGSAAEAASGGVRSLEGALQSESRTLRTASAEAARASLANRTLARSTAGSGAAAGQATSKFGNMISALGSVGAVAGGSSSALGRLGGTMGQVGSSASQMGGSFGAAGGALAILTAATAAYTELAAQQERQVAAQRRSIEGLGRSYRDLARDIEDTASRRAELAEIRAGRGTSAQTIGRSQELRNQLEVMSRALAGDGEAADSLRRRGITGERAGSTNRGVMRNVAGFLVGNQRAGVGALTEGEGTAVIGAMETITRELQQTTQALATVTGRTNADAARIRAGGDATSPGASGGGGGDLEARGEASRQRARDLVDAELTRRAQAQMARDAEVHSEAMKASEERMELERLAREERDTDARKEIDDINRASAARLEAAEKLKTAHQEASAARADELRTITGEIEGQLVRVASLFTGAFKTAIKGEKAFEEALAEGGIKLLEMLGDELVAKGIGSILEGATMLVTNPPGAASKIGGGTALVAFGATLGAVSAAIPSPGGAGAPTSPVEDRPADGNDGPGELTLVINSPVQTAQTNAELARQLGRQLESETPFAVGG